MSVPSDEILWDMAADILYMLDFEDLNPPSQVERIADYLRGRLEMDK